MAQWWARVRKSHDFNTFPAEKYLSVFVPFQPWHVSRLGIRSQAELTSDFGIHDVHVKYPSQEGPRWTFDEAVSYCENSFREHLGKNPDDAIHRMMNESLSGIEAAEYAQICAAPNGQISQPICVPSSSVDALISESQQAVDAYYLLYHAGIQAIRTQSLDSQPQAFRDWFAKAVEGVQKPPRQRPRGWINLGRDWQIIVLVQTLTSQGLNKTRNDVSEATSAYDAIAEAACNVGLRGVTNYQTVKSIVSRHTKSWRG